MTNIRSMSKLLRTKRFRVLSILLAFGIAGIAGISLQNSKLNLENPKFNDKAYTYDYKRENYLYKNAPENKVFTVTGNIYNDNSKQKIVKIIPDALSHGIPPLFFVAPRSF